MITIHIKFLQYTYYVPIIISTFIKYVSIICQENLQPSFNELQWKESDTHYSNA